MRRAPRSTAESLMRWLAAWLAVAVCVQAFAVGAASWRTHRHGALDADVQSTLLWRHTVDSAHARDAHERAHVLGEAHQHAPDDASVLGADAHAAALAAWVGAPAPRAQGALSAANGLRHVQMAAEPWSPTARAVSPLRQPPRA